MDPKIIIWFLTKDHFRKTLIIDRGKGRLQIEAIAIILTITMEVEKANYLGLVA